LRAATYRTLLGLLASSGLRIGEAIGLDGDDIDWAQGVLLIRESKFGKSRLVPLHDSVIRALREYEALRSQTAPRPKDPAFFISRTRRRLIYLHRPNGPATPSQPTHHRRLPATRCGCCSSSSDSAPAPLQPAWTGPTAQ
jgi:integrase